MSARNPPTLAGHHHTVVIGGGQAGLAMSYCLGEADIEHIVIEKHTVGHEWRERRWDSFCLVTPNWQCTLPGFPYRGPDPHGFMGRDQIVAYIEAYAAMFRPPLFEHVTVTGLRRAGALFEVTTTAGACRAENVVLAVGGYHQPAMPRLAERIPSGIAVLHSAAYRNPQSLPDGEATFAPDLAANLDRADAVSEGIKDKIDRYIAAHAIVAPGEPRYVPVWQPPEGPGTLDLAAERIAAVIFCTGFHSDYRWVDVPVFDGRGYPRHQRGVTSVDGLYVLGLPWLHTWGSGRFSGIADDAEHLADHIARRRGVQFRAAS
jgi:glycine/D-amino acid oxidase-like deaminating enzyme